MTQCVLHHFHLVLNVLTSHLFLKMNLETTKITAELLELYSFKDLRETVNK